MSLTLHIQYSCVLFLLKNFLVSISVSASSLLQLNLPRAIYLFAPVPFSSNHPTNSEPYRHVPDRSVYRIGHRNPQVSASVYFCGYHSLFFWDSSPISNVVKYTSTQPYCNVFQREFFLDYSLVSSFVPYRFPAKGDL